MDRVGRKYARWTAQAYFELDGAYLVEYCHGNVEILPKPTITHQRVASRLYAALLAAAPSGSDVLFAGTRVRVAEDTYRELDVLYIPLEWRSSVHEEFTERAGLVIEVLSESNRDYDLETKRREYAAAGIPEYWIADPELSRITILTLQGTSYRVKGESIAGEVATSGVLPGFSVEIAKIFAAE